MEGSDHGIVVAVANEHARRSEHVVAYFNLATAGDEEAIAEARSASDAEGGGIADSVQFVLHRDQAPASDKDIVADRDVSTPYEAARGIDAAA